MLQPTYPLKTPRLILRPFTRNDITAFHAIYSHPEVVRFLLWEPHRRTESRQLLEKKAEHTTLTRPGQTLSLGIELVETGELIGDASLTWASHEHGTGEIMIILHPRHHGKGYAAEAATEVFRLGFDELGLHRIFGRCDPRNIASASLMEGLGMRQEAHLREVERVKGEWTDELVYAILATEWQKS
ncbi:RimJ/RimL family protein N-acetyltransferase [Amycolatopsis bartoniae]|uniref:N-acetyltransferase n=1 Tax=Amycolatopsis bartoniae TaxID=941986 RepID=A0A8H9J2F7_9PSEU|nr:GNAT family protein [Amycolatopsis bartoniae]MBB2935454.1 RimJ/RimL family protein N-acetyltransferase [Amycolatopsis bartoniae]TVT04468.1 GNAT family N-acetyltransferase [Amycolatopsis bartoniae]GHF76135.1 N-acetyltransferase [Amycolatopsis bartoniae]